MSERWYTAALVFATSLEDDEEFSISLIPLRARDSAEASQIAERLGHEIATEYSSGGGAPGSWRLLKVLCVHEMIENELREGVELYNVFADRGLVEELEKRFVD